MSSKWIRLDTTWDESDWLAGLHPESQLAWVKLLCYTKAHGIRGTVKIPSVKSKMWGVTPSRVTALVTAAKRDGAIVEEGGFWTLSGFEKRNGDQTAADRARRYRQRRKEVTP